jgi:hypothetical protein
MARSHPSVVMALRPVFYCRLNEPAASAFVYDYTSTAVSGMVSGGVTLGVSGNIADNFTTAAFFNPSNAGFIEFGDVNHLSFPTNIFSMSFWARMDAPRAQQAILGKRGSPWEYTISKTSNSDSNLAPNLTFAAFTSGGTNAYVNTVSMPVSSDTGAWIHFTWVCDGTSGFVYKNGVQQPSIAGLVPGRAMANTTSPFRIGDGGGSGAQAYASGAIQDVAIFNYALTSGQVVSLYQAGATSIGYEITANPLKSLPAAAVNITLAGNATPWTNSAWAQITTGLASGIVIAYLLPVPGGMNSGTEYEIDLGIGTAGNEVVIGTYPGFKATSAAVNPWVIRPPLDAIPALTRIAWRYRKSDASTATNQLGLTYYEKPNLGVETSAAPPKVYPTAASGIAVQPVYSVTAFGACDWVEMTTGFTSGIVVLGVQAQPIGSISSTRDIIDIGIGAAGSEQLILRFANEYRFNSGYNGNLGPLTLPIPYDGIPAKTRIAVRVVPGPSSSNQPWKVRLLYLEKPLL